MKKLLLSFLLLTSLTSCEKYELEDFEKETPTTQINPPTNSALQPGDDGWVNPPTFGNGGGNNGGGTTYCPSGMWDIYGNCLP
jgi:hypothetical protein